MRFLRLPAAMNIVLVPSPTDNPNFNYLVYDQSPAQQTQVKLSEIPGYVITLYYYSYTPPETPPPETPETPEASQPPQEEPAP